MEDGKIINAGDDNFSASSVGHVGYERGPQGVLNGHDAVADTPASDRAYKSHLDTAYSEISRPRINPLKIHLSKISSLPNQQYNIKKKYTPQGKVVDTKLIITKPVNNATVVQQETHTDNYNVPPMEKQIFNPSGKPIQRNLFKNNVGQIKRSKVQKNQQKDMSGLQPTVKFKCRKCCSMSFKSLSMLKEHQRVCRSQAREPALSPPGMPATGSCTDNTGPSRVTRKVYLCSACGTYYENWNLFLHMREVHNRHICLFCLGMFSKADKLSAHLISKHFVEENNYTDADDFFSVYNGTLYLMCCTCDQIYSEKDEFSTHNCGEIKPKPVPLLVSKNSSKLNCPKIATKSITDKSISNGPGNEVAIKSLHSSNKVVSEAKDKLQPEKPTEGRIKLTLSLGGRITSKVEVSPPINNKISSTTETTELSQENAIKESSIERQPEINSCSKDLQSNCISNSTDRQINPEANDRTSAELSSPPNLSPDNLRPEPMEIEESSPPLILKHENNNTVPEKHKECGIKLKLSLNNAQSPVIINSTVDPTVGRKVLKPPRRLRRPPKRYVKDSPPTTPPSTWQPPSSPYTWAPLPPLSTPITPVTPTNTIKTTIYDNKPEEINTMNRVPKLTVRVPKELLDKDSSSDYDSDSDVSDKLTVDDSKELNKTDELSVEEENKPAASPAQPVLIPASESSPVVDKPEPEQTPSENKPEKEDTLETDQVSTKSENQDSQPAASGEDIKSEECPDVGSVGEEIPVIELTLNKPLDKYPLKDLLRFFVTKTMFNCIYCNHVRQIAVNCKQLSQHMIAQHRFKATVDSITAEELMPEKISAKLKSDADIVDSIFVNLDTYDSEEKSTEAIPRLITYECFQCYFKTPMHKELYLHNRKMHQKTILLCVMCKSNFYNYSELLCHLCPGNYNFEHEVKFRCCLCNVDSIPSSFRLMVHLRKMHHSCEVCLEACHNQSRLSNHVWKHKLHHLCYRCGIAYRNKVDIQKHLFWKHGTQSVPCKKCMQKKWPHVYHFCVPPNIFTCEECNLHFSKAVCLKVHKRFHSEQYPHVCQETDCTEKFVSKKLLMKHALKHREPDVIDVTPTLAEKKNDEPKEQSKDAIPTIDLVGDKPEEDKKVAEITKAEPTEKCPKKSKKKKVKDSLLPEVNLPALNLSESDSSDESDSGIVSGKTDEKQVDNVEETKFEGVEENKVPKNKEESKLQEVKDEKLEEKATSVKTKEEFSEEIKTEVFKDIKKEAEVTEQKIETKVSSDKDQLEPIETAEAKATELKALDIWDNFKQYQEIENKDKPEKPKTPPLVLIRKHVCESDHDYCLIPTDVNGDESPSKGIKKKSSKRNRHASTSSSSSSSDSNSSCSCGSNCSCSSSSGSSSSSSSSDSDSSDSDRVKKKKRINKRKISIRRDSNGSNVDVTAAADTPILIPEPTESPIAETDLETEESETDEEFYDEHPQRLANKIYAEKRNQLMLLASVAPSDTGSNAGDASRPSSPIIEKSSKKKSKSKKKKKSKNVQKTKRIKINIPKDLIAKSDQESLKVPPMVPNKITISLNSNSVQLPETPKLAPETPRLDAATSAERKRASKRRRVPNKFYGYSSDEENMLKPTLPPKLEWKKEDLPSPSISHKVRKEELSSSFTHRFPTFTDSSFRLTAPIPDPVPPPILMNNESVESSDSDSSEEGALEICQSPERKPTSSSAAAPVAAPSYLFSGTSSLPYTFPRPPNFRQAREGESVYCYCRCPYDEVSEMIACDADGCAIEWFHFECVGIMVPPKGKWYCPDCRQRGFGNY